MQLENVTMNRAMRRALAKGKRPEQEKLIPLPSLLEEFTIFDIPQTILSKLRNGEIEAQQGIPVFFDNTGELNEVCPAMAGWIYTWKKLNEKLNLNLWLEPLEKVNNKLHAAIMLTEKDVAQAQAALDSCRAAFRRTDRQAIQRISQDAQIALQLGAL